jgi:hypothetical protein
VRTVLANLNRPVALLHLLGTTNVSRVVCWMEAIRHARFVGAGSNLDAGGNWERRSRLTHDKTNPTESQRLRDALSCCPIPPPLSVASSYHMKMTCRGQTHGNKASRLARQVHRRPVCDPGCPSVQWLSVFEFLHLNHHCRREHPKLLTQPETPSQTACFTFCYCFHYFALGCRRLAGNNAHQFDPEANRITIHSQHLTFGSINLSSAHL